MPQKRELDPVKSEIERGHFVRAVLMAEQMGLPEEEIRDLRIKALGQMSAIYRNAHGTKYPALQYGYSKEELKHILEEFANEMKNKANTKPLAPRYDYSTGKYLSFEEWVDHYLRIWDRLSR